MAWGENGRSIFKCFHVIAGAVALGATTVSALAATSTMTATNLGPANGATGICVDSLLRMTFDAPITLTNFGKVRIFNVTNTVTAVDTIDVSLGKVQARTIAGESFNTYPDIISNNTATIFPHAAVLAYNQTYFVTVDPGVFADSNKATYAGLANTNAWRFSTKPSAPGNHTNLVVAANGSGDFATVQGAVDFLPANNTTHTLLNIRNGVYTEIVDVKSKNNITFRGESRNGVVVKYPNNANITTGGNTHFRMSFKVLGNDIAIESLTLLNSTPKGGSQAEALMLETGTKRFILNNAEVDSYQDTFLGNTTDVTAYFNNSLIQGDVDYLWGGVNLFVTNCEVRTVTAGGNITQARTTAGQNGMSFVNCLLTVLSNGVVNCTLGRAIGIPNGNVCFARCRIACGAFTGWTSGDVSTSRYWEYANSNLTGTASCTYNGTQLTNGDIRLINALSVSNWLGGWVPQLTPNITSQPASLVVTTGQSLAFAVGATGIPEPVYQWLKAGTNLAGATSATLSIASAQADDGGMYSVMVSNRAGVITSTNAILTVTAPGTSPTATFTANPTNGVEPLAVTFTDTSSGSSPLSLSWNFGDSTATNTGGGANFMRAYPAGVYTVTLIASNSAGISSLALSNLIRVITAFQAWQLQYFGCTNCPQADLLADADGDGLNNQAEFLAGTDPSNSASTFQIISTVPQGDHVLVTWLSAGGRTNTVQATGGDVDGSYNSNFVDISPPIVIPSSGDTATSYLDNGGATNSPARYYRVRLVP